MARVALRNLTKGFGAGAKPVLRDLSLEVSDGEFVVLLGPSGCGKTTALRCVAGLESPDSGEILIGDRDVTLLPPAERDVAMVFQNYALYPHLTARQNIAFPLEMRGLRKAEVSRRVQETAARLGLGELLDRRPGQLSGGQRQRVALGRAIVRAPQVFLFDEPLSNLDARLRVETRAELRQLHCAGDTVGLRGPGPPGGASRARGDVRTGPGAGQRSGPGGRAPRSGNARAPGRRRPGPRRSSAGDRRRACGRPRGVPPGPSPPAPLRRGGGAARMTRRAALP